MFRRCTMVPGVLSLFSAGDIGMKRAILFIVASISTCSIQSCFGSTIIDFPCNNYSVATRANMAELITVPLGSDTWLDSFQFYDMVGTGSPTPFHAVVYEFDPVEMMTVGSPLYDSGLQNATMYDRKTYAFLTGGISLTPGGHYILGLYQEEYECSSNLDVGVSGDEYNDGGFLFNSYGVWCSLPHVQSLAFQAVFNPVPEPSTVVLVGVSAIGLFGYAWRWRWRVGG